MPIAGILAAGFAAALAAGPPPPSLVLITLDTTRADHVGRLDDGRSRTPNLDGIGRAGLQFSRAIASSPLTLPSHCSLMTGADPPAHGVRDNGISALSAERPTIASVLAARGYQTGAFVSSRILDRRFGLGHGFAVYDDAMAAERIGELGYPERDAAAVTAAALAWTAGLSPDRPYFLWVHYYDPHAPYAPPGPGTGASGAERYAGEIAYMDREIGRLLAGLPGPEGRRVVAAVGDHGEMLGEHGERDHGLLLYRGSLEVPLLIAGPGVARGRVVKETVGTRGLAAFLLARLGWRSDAAAFGPALPASDSDAARAAAVYSETFLPASVYGWSPLRAVSRGSLRFVDGPIRRLFDFVADPSESRNLASGRPRDVERLGRAVAEAERATGESAAGPSDPDLAESLRRLGYLSGTTGARAGTIDPHDGIRLLPDFDAARARMREGRPAEAVALLEALCRKSPGNVPFLMRLGEARIEAGQVAAGIETLESAVALNPGLDFLQVRLGQAYASLGRAAPAREAYARALDLNPRSAPAWSGLAEIARATGPPGEELRTLRRADAAGTGSGSLLTRMAELELAGGELVSAEGHAGEAVRLTPSSPAAWRAWAQAAERLGRAEEAKRRLERAESLRGPGGALR